MVIAFYGAAYQKADTATGDGARRMETSSKKLTHVIVEVRTQGQNFGLVDTYPTSYVYYTAGSKFEMFDVDISTLYFANATAGANGTVSMLGVCAE